MVNYELKKFLSQIHNFFNDSLGRRNKYKVISHLNVESLENIQRFYLKVLLCNIKRARNYKDLCTFEGIVYETF